MVINREDVIFIIGIAGKIGSGKTTVARILGQQLENSLLIDVDSLAKQLYENYPDLLKDIRMEFGDQVFSQDRLDYGQLAKKVFTDQSQLTRLNRIMFPLIRSEIKEQIQSNQHKDYIIIDAAVLFNCKLNILCDHITWVKAPPRLRKKYLVSKGISEAEAEMKIKGQKIRIDKSLVDRIIDNHRSEKRLAAEAEDLARDIVFRSSVKNGKQV
ncbi:MAG: dephospho-CoA kinase [Actinomycetia bacterium]|nr:dephospho-CoA kinase [Actinomycetes bacterium]